MRLIDADALVAQMKADAEQIEEPIAAMFAYAAISDVEHAPTIEPERKKGKWNFIGDNMFECTCCGTPYTTQQLDGLRNYNTDPYAPNFCPYCGSYNGDESDDIPIEYFESGGK